MIMPKKSRISAVALTDSESPAAVNRAQTLFYNAMDALLYLLDGVKLRDTEDPDALGQL
jgi:hypothetical protein